MGVARKTVLRILHIYQDLGLAKVRLCGEGWRSSIINGVRFNATLRPKPPLTDYVTSLRNEGLEDDFDALVAVLLLTDGGLLRRRNWYSMNFYGESPIMHSVFVDLIYYAYQELPTSYMIEERGGYRTVYNSKRHREIAEELLGLSPTYKTSPAIGQHAEDYLKEQQPTLKFIFNKNIRARTEALRLAMAAEGSIEPQFCYLQAFPILSLACAHPRLVEGWKKLVKKAGLGRPILMLGGSWSGIAGLKFGKLKFAERFLELVGFIEGVSITSKSKRYCGLSKNALLRSVMKYRQLSENERRRLVALPLKERHSVIHELARTDWKPF